MFMNKNDFQSSDEDDDQQQQKQNDNNLILIPDNQDSEDEDDFFKNNPQRQQYENKLLQQTNEPQGGSSNNVYNINNNFSTISNPKNNINEYSKPLNNTVNNFNYSNINKNNSNYGKQTIDQLLYQDDDDEDNKYTQGFQNKQNLIQDKFQQSLAINDNDFDQNSRNQQKIQNNTNNNFNSSSTSFYNKTQNNFNSTQDSFLPNNSQMTSSQNNLRIKAQQQQRQSFIEKQNLKLQTGTIVTNQNYKPNMNYVPEYQSKLNDRDLDEISRILQQPTNQTQYEPGISNLSSKNLPQLDKQDNLIRNQDEIELSKQQEKQKQNQQQQQDLQQQVKQQKQIKTLKKAKDENSEDDSGENQEQEEQINQKKQQKQLQDQKNSKQKTNKKKQETESEESDDDDDEEKKMEEEMMMQEKKSTKDKKQNKDMKVEMVNEKVDKDKQQIEKPLNVVKPIDHMEIANMKQFLTEPAPKGYMIQCTIKRDKSGMARFFPIYHLCLSGQSKYLMSAKKKPYNKTSNYLISMSKSDFKKNSDQFIGKVRSNFLGTEFTMYDNGNNPKKASILEKVRTQLGTIIYDQNILGTKGPRKMKVLIPDVKEDGTKYEWRPLDSKQGILQSYKQGLVEGIKFLFNKPPKWNEQVQAFVLNFNGRVDKPSVKNFQLIDQKDENRVYLQFGRIGDNAFNIDFQWPISPQQAFSIALSSFDYKFACE